MSVIDDVLKANDQFAKDFRLAQVPRPPAKKLAIVACMDARLMIERLLGLEVGDAHIIRNAGGFVTDDALRSLLISHYLLGTQEFMVINHTDCGMMSFQDAELRAQLEKQTGQYPVSPVAFHAFADLDENVSQQIARIRSHPWVPQSIAVRGFIYDVKTGQLREVASAPITAR